MWRFSPTENLLLATKIPSCNPSVWLTLYAFGRSKFSFYWLRSAGHPSSLYFLYFTCFQHMLIRLAMRSLPSAKHSLLCFVLMNQQSLSMIDTVLQRRHGRCRSALYHTIFRKATVPSQTYSNLDKNK